MRANGAARRVRRFLSFLKDEVHFGGFKAGQLDIETEVDQRLQLDGQDFPVPPCLLSELVVGEDVSPLIGLAEMRQPYGRHLPHAEQLGGGHPAVARNDLSLVVNENRVAEAELQDAVRDLPDLLPRVCPRVPQIRPERFDRKGLDLH